jgi:hypothetical protein
MFLIRLLSGKSALLRDGRGKGKPMKTISVEKYTLFNELPAGLTTHGGPNVEVKAVASAAEAQAFEQAMAKTLEAEAAERESYARKVKAKRERMLQAAEAPKAEDAAVARTPARLAHNSHGRGARAAAKPTE